MELQHHGPPLPPPPVKVELMPQLAEALTTPVWLDAAWAAAEERRQQDTKAGPWLSAEQRQRVGRQMEREQRQL